ncbi:MULTISPECIES: hypothetical protein [Deinococcus]|uniref:Uncharacterized protein n=2 Tax=Deinococcus TaxID=1298 RepID=H8H2U4_DEIGI|nr:hypothetical protein [Deinococcus gobiensis]AFD27841.1 hypothetical protein DGo_PC0049 [Deinococcus gobiensis I-0]
MERLREAVASYDLHYLTTHLDLGHAPHLARSRLRPIFDDARARQLDLLHPPQDVTAWLKDLISIRLTALGPASINTQLARLTALSNLYEALILHGLTDDNPTRRYVRPAAQHRDEVPCSPQQISVLLQQTKDIPLRLALYFTYAFNFRAGELLRLRWEHINVSTGEITRARTIIQLAHIKDRGVILRLIHRHLKASGGPQFAAGKVFPWEDLLSLSYALRQAWRHAFRPPEGEDAIYYPLTQIRKAGLRDNPLNLDPVTLGYTSPYWSNTRRAKLKPPNPT